MSEGKALSGTIDLEYAEDGYTDDPYYDEYRGTASIGRSMVRITMPAIDSGLRGGRYAITVTLTPIEEKSE